jgi:hypothetical protein
MSTHNHEHGHHHHRRHHHHPLKSQSATLVVPNQVAHQEHAATHQATAQHNSPTSIIDSMKPTAKDLNSGSVRHTAIWKMHQQPA